MIDPPNLIDTEKQTGKDAYKRFSKQIKVFIELFGDVLETLKSILIAILSLILLLSQDLSKAFKDYMSRPSITLSNSPKMNYTNTQRMTTSSSSNIPDKKEDRPKLGKGDNKVNTSYFYPVMATLSTFALLWGGVRLGPIAQWAKTQNQCIELTTTNDPNGNTNLNTKVMKCNGGHE